MNRSPDLVDIYTFTTFPNESQSNEQDKSIIEAEDSENIDEDESGAPVATLIETDRTSESYLMTALRRKNVDLKGLVEEWWRTYNTDPTNGLKEIIELLYHSTGWKSFTFYNELDRDAIRKYIKKKVDVTFVNPTALNWNFIDRFGVFLEELLEQNSGQLLNNESFIKPIINSCSILKTGSWTSYRMVAVVAGMKIMTRLHSSYETIILELSAPKLPDNYKADLKDKKETVFKLWYLLFQNVFKLSIRDAIYEVRRVAINEMLNWASKNPSLLLGKRWQKYIYLALRDTNSYNRDLAYNMVHHLFSNEIDQTKQFDLFKCLKIELFFALQNMEGIPPYKSICVCTNLAKYIDPALSKEESFLIYICVYYKSQIIAFKAAEYLMMQLQKMVNTSHALIKHLIIFNKEGMVHTESLLMDVLYYFIHPILSWDDWFTCIAGCNDKYVEQTVAMFFAYVHKAVVGYTPPSRIKWKLLQMKKNVLIQNKAKFTKSLGRHWIKLINMNKILKFPEAVIRMIKILQFTGLQLSPEVITEICKKLSDTFLTSNEKRVVCESCKSIQHLINVAGTSRTNLTSIQKQLVDEVLAEFMEYIKVPLCTLIPGPIHNRIVYLCQNFDFDDQLIWETCKNNLLTTSINKHSDELIIVLMNIFYSRLFYYLKVIMELYSKENSADENNSLSEENDESVLNYLCDNSHDLCSAGNLTKTQIVNKINSRASEVHGTIKIFLNCKFSYPVNIMAFKIMATFIEYLGPHMINHSTMWEFTTNIDEDVESGMVDIVEVAFQNDCPYKSHSVDTRRTLGECCQIVQRYCNLLSEGILDWIKASQIIILIKENKWHGDYIAHCINIFIKHFPAHFHKPGIAIYNAVATSVRLEVKKRSSSKELDSAKNILEELFLNRRVSDSEGDLICFLHEVIIKQAYAKDGFKPLIKLLYPLRSILRNDDISKILQLLNKLKNQYPEQLTEYTSILKERQRVNSLE